MTGAHSCHAERSAAKHPGFDATGDASADLSMTGAHSCHAEPSAAKHPGVDANGDASADLSMTLLGGLTKPTA